MQGSRGYAEWTMTGTDVGMFKTNKHYEVRGASIGQGSSEKLTRETDYWDMATLMKQLGVLPEQPNELFGGRAATKGGGAKRELTMVAAGAVLEVSSMRTSRKSY